jgi:hypothetical protein
MTGKGFSSLESCIGDLPYLKRWRSCQISSYDRSGGNLDCISVPPGERAIIGEADGPGCISRIWFTIASQDPEVLRKTILRFYWDGEDDPSVESPFGDFFGVGFSEYVHHHSIMHGMTSGGYFSYWPMPFGSRAKLEVLNMSDREIRNLYFNIQYHKLDALGDDVARFHAKWSRENPTTIGKNYAILEAQGRGHFVGCVLNMQSFDKGSMIFLEGDEMIYVDGEEAPSIHGTGTEDYFGGGYYFSHGCFHSPFQGLTLFDGVNARVSAYRLHVLDAIPFEKGIRVTIEHGHDNMLQEDYSSLAYWYQEEPHDRSFGHIPEDDVEYLTPLPSKASGYLMTEMIQDTEVNAYRRSILKEAAVLRLRMRQAIARGSIPPELKGLNDEQFLQADFAKLKEIVERARIKEKKS